MAADDSRSSPVESCDGNTKQGGTSSVARRRSRASGCLGLGSSSSSGRCTGTLSCRAEGPLLDVISPLKFPQRGRATASEGNSRIFLLRRCLTATALRTTGGPERRPADAGSHLYSRTRGLPAVADMDLGYFLSSPGSVLVAQHLSFLQSSSVTQPAPWTYSWLSSCSSTRPHRVKPRAHAGGMTA